MNDQQYLDWDRRMNNNPWAVRLALTLPFQMAFIAIHLTLCAISALGILDYEYSHGKRIKWNGK